MSDAEKGPSARLTIHRTSPLDDQTGRQIYCSIDGQYMGQLLHGGRLSREIAPGPHTLSVNNTLFWKKVPFHAEPGGDVQFTVWNEIFGGNVTRLLFIFVGAAPLKLRVAPGPPS
ncbi:MAG TPA: hypothetical protein VIL35_03770 [Vicinamibacterales bacterium]